MPDEPATKQDLQTAITESEDRLRTFIAESIAQSEDHLKEFSRDLQTEVFRAICEIAESGNKRMTALERSDIGLTERFAALENRVLGIEKRLNLPPGTAA